MRLIGAQARPHTGILSPDNATIIHFSPSGLEWSFICFLYALYIRIAARSGFLSASSKIVAMPYLIDGHNLVPKAGLRLDSLDDEMQLIGLIQEFARLSRHEAQIYFDGAPAGSAGTRRYGSVTAHFVRVGSSADAAIKGQISRLGRSARNWTVVTSDRSVQAAARAAHAGVISSEDFARQLRRVRESANRPAGEPELTPDEIREWLKLFEDRD